MTRGTLDFFMRRFSNMRTCLAVASTNRCRVRGSRFDRDVAAATGLHGRYAVFDWLLVESTVQFAVDLGGGLRWGKRTILYLCPLNYVFQFIINYNTIGSSAVVFGRCTVTQFCEVRATHKFDFRLVINKTPNNRQPVASRSRSDIVSCF